MPSIDDKVITRFWKYVQKTDTCWLWIGAIDTTGYGKLNIDRKAVSVHRLSYTLHIGTIPADLYVLHHCDVRACINPEHLFLGTHLDNIRDMLQKKRHLMAIDPQRILEGARQYNRTHPTRPKLSGIHHWSQRYPDRIPRGERHGSRTKPGRLPRGIHHHKAKLTEEQVREIRTLYAAAEGRRGIVIALARRFGVTRTNVGSIVRRKIWGFLSDEPTV